MITISESTNIQKFSGRVTVTTAIAPVPTLKTLPPLPGSLADIEAQVAKGGPVTAGEIIAFVKAASDRHLARLKAQYPTCEANHETLDYMLGKRYARIVTINPINGGIRSAFGFIEIATGNLLKSDGWNRPAKGVRGNIRIGDASNGWNGAVGDHGMAYLR